MTLGFLAMAEAVIVESLIELYTEEEIRGFWKQTLDALIDRSTTNLHIKRIDRDGQSDEGIVLSSKEEMEGFISSCKEAVRRINAEEGENHLDPHKLSRGTDRSHRQIRV